MEERLGAEVRISATPDVDSNPLFEELPGFVLAPETRALIERCMDGTEPIENKKANHVDKFSTRHLQVVMLRLAGLKGKDIAEIVGIERPWVSVILHHPYATKIIKSAFPHQAATVIDIRSKIERHVDELLDHALGMALKEQDLDKISRVTFGLLDRAGYQPVNKSVTVNARPGDFAASPHTLKRIEQALDDSNKIDQEIMPNWVAPKPPEDGIQDPSQDLAADEGIESGDRKS